MLYLLYFSPTGGTERVCRLLAGAWEEEGRPVDLTRRDADVSRLRLGAEDICLVAVPAFAGRVPQIAAQRLGQLTGGGAQAVPVAVFGNRAWEDTLLETRDLLLERGFRCPAAVAAVAEHSIFRQYGAGRPDEEDRRQLAAFSQQLRQHLAQFPEGDGGRARPSPLPGLRQARPAARGVRRLYRLRPVRRRLPGEGHFRRAAGRHRYRAVHRLSALRLPVPGGGLPNRCDGGGRRRPADGAAVL